jgi:DNA recombination protein RmuC
MMEIAIGLIGVALGAALGIALGVLLGKGRAAVEVVGLRAQLAEQRTLAGDRVKAAVFEVAQTVSESLAQQTAREAKDRLEAQKLALAGVVDPVQAKLTELEDAVKKAEGSRIAGDAKLLAELEGVGRVTADLTKQTGKFTTALTGGQSRGKWGELQLELILEKAGLTKHITWQTQQQEGSGRGAQRPDLLVHLPEGRVLVVDAKAPTLDLEGDVEGDKSDRAFAAALRTHIKALDAKNYIDNTPGAVGYVFLFLPSEAAYAGALRADPNVLEFAIENRVSVVAPSTLLSTLTAVGSIWREFEANQHIDDALNDARELHKRLQTFVNHLNNLGTHLTRAVGAYNQSISSFDARLIPQARKLEAANLASSQFVLEVKPVTDGVNPVTTACALPTPDGEPTLALDAPLEDTNG